jgi:hypothetical protein
MGPFAFFSAIELPELRPESADALRRGIPVHILLGETPSSIRSATFRGEFCTASASEFLMQIPEVGSYYVRNGAEVTVQPHPGVSLVDVRGFLLGNVFAVLCHQRRLLPLHASAVRIGDGVVAFLGASGAGKSTLAGYLSQAGYALVADDICLLDPGAAPEERVLPVAPWLKLWRASLEALGHDADGLTQTFTDEDKFRLPLNRPPSRPREDAGDALPLTALPLVVQDDRLPLRAVVVLARHEAGSDNKVMLIPLTPVQAIGQMMKFTYQAFLLDWLGLRGEHFASCGKALEGAKAYNCERSWGFEELPEILDRLRQEFG